MTNNEFKRKTNKLRILKDQIKTGKFFGTKSDVNAEIYFLENELKEVKALEIEEEVKQPSEYGVKL